MARVYSTLNYHPEDQPLFLDIINKRFCIIYIRVQYFLFFVYFETSCCL